MYKLPEVVQPPESPCALLQDTWHKPSEICFSHAEVAPRVFLQDSSRCRCGLAVANCCLHRGWEHLLWKSAGERAQGDQHKGSQRARQTCRPFSAPKGLCTALAARTRLLVLRVLEQDWQQRELRSTFPYALHEASSFPGAIATNLPIAGPKFQESNIFLR